MGVVVAGLLEVWTSRLGANVCDRCLALHGRVFLRGQGPYPPLHPNCRCRRDPIIAVTAEEEAEESTRRPRQHRRWPDPRAP